MDSNRKIAMVVGILFIIGSVFPAISLTILDPILDDSEYLTEISENENQVVLAVIFQVIMGVVLIAISIVMYPILRQHDEKLAIGYFIARTVEVVLLTINLIAILAVFSLSEDFANTEGQNLSEFTVIGDTLLAIREWSWLLGVNIAFAISALLLNYSFYKSKIIPRWISVWGLIGGTLIFMLGIWGIFGNDIDSNPAVALNWPIGINEMVLAVWLIVKGFNSSAID
ncbi:MAG: DUF4386 domain-containing protein [Candidatus Kariarchaeaceae archaeon]|jgi:hypothetical protein